MTDTEKLSTIHLLSLLSPQELALFAEACQSARARTDEVFFSEGDPGDTLYLLVSGRVQLLKRIMEGHDEMLPIVFAGDIFGEMTFLDGTPRSSSAMALEDCELYAVSRPRFDRLMLDRPEIALKIFQQLGRILTGRLRTTNERVKDCIQWNLQISGATALGIQHLLSNKIQMDIELANGRRITGTILLVVNTDLGYQVTVKDQLGRLYIVPYGSINYLSVREEDFQTSVQE